MRILLVTIGLVLSATSCTDNSLNDVDPGTVLTSDVQTGSNEANVFQFSDSSFQEFYMRFISDSLFQLDNIIFPLSGNYQDYENEIPWNKESWPQIKLDLENQQQKTDSISIIQNDSAFFYGFYCLDCGFSYERRFKKINNFWKLTHRQENNF